MAERKAADIVKRDREQNSCDVCGEYAPLITRNFLSGDGKAVRHETCKNCGAKACKNCSKRSPKGSRFCMHCGWTSTCPNCDFKLPDSAKFCPSCGASRMEGRPIPRPVDEARKTEATTPRRPAVVDKTPEPQPVTYRYLQVHAVQGEMAMGRSLVANMFGAPALIKCKFEVMDEVSGKCVAGVDFLVYAGRDSIENLSSIDRSEAEQALREIDKLMISRGADRISGGPHWYSHRYRVQADSLRSR
jgi:hypothetical protein